MFGVRVVIQLDLELRVHVKGILPLLILLTWSVLRVMRTLKSFVQVWAGVYPRQKNIYGNKDENITYNNKTNNTQEDLKKCIS